MLGALCKAKSVKYYHTTSSVFIRGCGTGSDSEEADTDMEREVLVFAFQFGNDIQKRSPIGGGFGKIL